jgi:hypothetical protein
MASITSSSEVFAENLGGFSSRAESLHDQNRVIESGLSSIRFYCVYKTAFSESHNIHAPWWEAGLKRVTASGISYLSMNL